MGYFDQNGNYLGFGNINDYVKQQYTAPPVTETPKPPGYGQLWEESLPERNRLAQEYLTNNPYDAGMGGSQDLYNQYGFYNTNLNYGTPDQLKSPVLNYQDWLTSIQQPVPEQPLQSVGGVGGPPQDTSVPQPGPGKGGVGGPAILGGSPIAMPGGPIPMPGAGKGGPLPGLITGKPTEFDAGTGSPPVMGGGMMMPGSLGDQITAQNQFFTDTIAPGYTPQDYYNQYTNTMFGGTGESALNTGVAGATNLYNQSNPNFSGMGGLTSGALQDPNAPPLDQYGNPIVAPGDIAGSWAQAFR